MIDIHFTLTEKFNKKLAYSAFWQLNLCKKHILKRVARVEQLPDERKEILTHKSYADKLI